jgi:hypothetical protein
MRPTTIIAAGVLAAVAFAAPAQAATVTGTVVHRDARARSFVLAGASGRLTAIHATRLPATGSFLTVSASALRNGTFAARHLRGVVTFVDRAAGAFTLSAPGVSMLVRRGHAAGALPAAGSAVTIEGHVESDGELEAEDVQEHGTRTAGIHLEGRVLAIEPVARTLTISADDDAHSGAAITVTVPASIDLTLFVVGAPVELQATLQPDGTYMLVGSASDAGSRGANDGAEQQGREGGGEGHDEGSPESPGAEPPAGGA